VFLIGQMSFFMTNYSLMLTAVYDGTRELALKYRTSHTMSEYKRSVLVLRLFSKWIGSDVKNFNFSNLAPNRSMGLT